MMFEVFIAIFGLGALGLVLFGVWHIISRVRGKIGGDDALSGLTGSAFFRSLIVAGITLLLLIPLAFVDDVVTERAAFQREAIGNIANLWGKPQTIAGPALAVPYEVWRETRETITNDEGKSISVPKRYRQAGIKLFLPKNLHILAVLRPKTLHQGIYDYVVYTSPLALSGEFTLLPESEFDDDVAAVHWDKAWVSLGVSDVKALSTEKRMTWNGLDRETFSPGTDMQGVIGPGFHITVPVDPKREIQSFLLTVALQGSGGIYFAPVGETTALTVFSTWNAPSFAGNLSPRNRSIANNGFTADWSIPNLSRTYPQVGELDSRTFVGDRPGESILSFTPGVDLYESVSLYRMTTRAVKYGVLFIGLTFIALFCFELSAGARLHFMQYGLVGVSMSLFYLVLLSLAEHCAFPLAFAAAALISVVMNGLYIMAAMRNVPRGLTVMGLLTGLYAVLYALLKMEDYALLMGTALVLVALGVLMYLTRHLPVAGSPSPPRNTA